MCSSETDLTPHCGKDFKSKKTLHLKKTNASPAMKRTADPRLPLTSPLPGCEGQGETLPLPWVYKSIQRVLPEEARIELEAVELIAAAAGEFLALASFQAGGRVEGGALDASSLFRAMRELGFERHEELLAGWYNKRVLEGAGGGGAASAATAAAAASGPKTASSPIVSPPAAAPHPPAAPPSPPSLPRQGGCSGCSQVDSLEPTLLCSVAGCGKSYHLSCGGVDSLVDAHSFVCINCTHSRTLAQRPVEQMQ